MGACRRYPPAPLAGPKPLETLRQRLEKHRTKPDCAACHNRMDPLGLEHALKELAEGYFEPHICTVAAPVRDDSGHIAAAIGITVPGSEISMALRDKLVAHVVDAGKQLSSRLNFREQIHDETPLPIGRKA